MITRLVLLSVALFALPACAQRPAASTETSWFEGEPPSFDLHGPKHGAPKEAPPGKLCLVKAPEQCEGVTEIIQKPYRGGGDLYYATPSKAAKEPPSAPSSEPPHN